MAGWIKIHRAIQTHWIFSDADKYKAWMIILFTVNFEPKKVNIKNSIFECKRGESLLSLDSWAKLFGKNWNKSKVRRFFKLLENDSMIVLKSEHKTTRLTVCNYDNYQDERNADETQTKRKRNANETQTTPTKEGKELKEGKEGKEYYKPSIEEIKKYTLEKGYEVDANKIWHYYNDNDWCDAKGNKVKVWKTKILNNWCKEENKTRPKYKGAQRFKVKYRSDTRYHFHTEEQIKAHEVKMLTTAYQKTEHND